MFPDAETTPFFMLERVEAVIDRESDSTSAELELHLVNGQILCVPLADILDAHAVEVVLREAIGLQRAP